jgi:hypothetical protein
MLTENQWTTAHAIAQTLVQEKTDINELRKAISYLRNYVTPNESGQKFFNYLKTLTKNGLSIGHSRQTSGYYETIEATCTQYLKAYENDSIVMLQILGWVARLMRYYQNSGPIGEIPASVAESARQAEIAEVVASQELKIGQILEATVTNIKGNKVTYEILGTIKLTEKEPKKAASLSESQNVQVEIVDLKEDGSIKKVKLVG